MIWLMVLPGSARWRFIKAEPPCWKGEIGISLRWFNCLIGWQIDRSEGEKP